LSILASLAPVRTMPQARFGAVDPRARVVLSVGFALVTVGLSELVALFAALAMATGLMIMAHLPVGSTLRRMAAMDLFIFALIAMLPFTTPGTPMFTIFGFEASREGLHHAVQIALTANAVALAMLALLGTMEAVTLGHALHALRCPERLVQLMMFTVRYIEVLGEEYARMRQAMRARGFRPRSNWHSYRSYGYLVGMMLVRAIERSERILGAMKCRGFTGRIPLLERFEMRRRDWQFVAGFAVALAALIGIEVANVFV